MSKSFVAHVEALQLGSPQVEELKAAASSLDTLQAYARAYDLDLTEADARRVVAIATPAGPLDDADLDTVAGGGILESIGDAAGAVYKALFDSGMAHHNRIVMKRALS